MGTKVVVAGAVSAALLAACSSGSPGSSGDGPTGVSSPPGSAPTSEPTSSSSSPVPTPAEDRDLDVHRLVVPPAAEAMPAAWKEQFVIGYGPGKQLLGTSPGGDSGSLDIGPEFGAPGPDGTWWFIDPAKQRIAHYDGSGRFLDQVKIPRDLLVDGHVQWALPHVLADGTLVATRFDPDRAWLLRLRDGMLDEIPVDGFVAPMYDDGRLLYGSSGHNRYAVVDPTDGSVQSTATFETPSGTPFLIELARSRLVVSLPESGVSKALPLRSRSGARAHVAIEVRAGADDTLHLFLYGAAEDDESLQLVGATLVSPAGEVAEVEALPNPFSEADSGSPAHLVMAPGSSTPMLVYVMPDGVHVYARVGTGRP